MPGPGGLLGEGRRARRRHLDVAPGEWLSVVGPNGAGKSTLLRALAGLVAARGTIEVGGRPLSTLTPRDRARVVALVPQNPVMPEGMPVLDYVMLGRHPHIPFFGFETTADVAVVERILDRLDLTRLRPGPSRHSPEVSASGQ
jgi:iron complex transport system ATP-binding protein